MSPVNLKFQMSRQVRGPNRAVIVGPQPPRCAKSKMAEDIEAAARARSVWPHTVLGEKGPMKSCDEQVTSI